MLQFCVRSIRGQFASPTVVLKKSSIRDHLDKYVYQQAIGEGKFLVLAQGLESIDINSLFGFKPEIFFLLAISS